MLWFFIGLTLATFLGIVFLFGYVYFTRARRVAESGVINLPNSVFWFGVDYFAVQLPLLLQAAGRSLFLSLLVYLKKFFAFVRRRLFWFENYFANLIDALKGRGGHGKRGHASVFLKEISRDKLGES